MQASLKEKFKKIQEELSPKSLPKDCELCKSLLTYQKPEPETSWEDKPSPVYARLTVLIYYSDDLFYEIRMCPDCASLYYYTLKTMSYQISYSTNDYDDFTPSVETCEKKTLGEVVDLVQKWPEKIVQEFFEKNGA